MRILLDECVPRPPRPELSGHDVRPILEMGWSGKKNGELLPLITSHLACMGRATTAFFSEQAAIEDAG